LQNLKRNPSIPLERFDVVLDVGEKEDICENLGFVEFVLEKWQTKG
jgi:hypothetical protein